MEQIFQVSGRLVNLNDYINAERTNRYRAAKMKRDEQDKVTWAIRAAGIKKMKGKIDISIAWCEPNMRRDKDNISFAKKFIFDALVECKIIPNDGWNEIGYIAESFSVNRLNPHITIKLEDHDPKGRTVHYMPITGGIDAN